MMNNIVILKKKYIRSTISIFSLLVVFSVILTSPVYAIAPPVELHLNTVIEPIAEFKLLIPGQVSPYNIDLTLGQPYTVGYTLTGNVPLYLSISSTSYVADGEFYMEHDTLGDAYKIPYTIKFDYADTAGYTTVTSDASKLMGGYNSSTGYNLTNKDLRIETATDAGDNLPEGDYIDTITFSFTTTQ